MSADRLAEIESRLLNAGVFNFGDPSFAIDYCGRLAGDVAWLVAEVKRLREKVEELSDWLQEDAEL